MFVVVSITDRLAVDLIARQIGQQHGDDHVDVLLRRDARPHGQRHTDLLILETLCRPAARLGDGGIRLEGDLLTLEEARLFVILGPQRLLVEDLGVDLLDEEIHQGRDARVRTERHGPMLVQIGEFVQGRDRVFRGTGENLGRIR